VRREAAGWYGIMQSMGLKSEHFPSIVPILVSGRGQFSICGRHGHGVVRHVYHHGGRHGTDPCLDYIASTYCSKFELIQLSHGPFRLLLCSTRRAHITHPSALYNLSLDDIVHRDLLETLNNVM
jgi:hypothetical protein